MEPQYVEIKSDGMLYLPGTRIALATVADAFRNGDAPEEIQMDYPALTLEQVYGAITFCLAHPAELDAYLLRLDREEQTARHASPPSDLRLRLQAYRAAHQTQAANQSR